jgi:ATP-binding cassette subfamily F protein 3
MIQLRNVSLELGGIKLFADVTCAIHRGDRIGVIGRNGAGKSTLFKLIAGRIKPTSGDISLERGLVVGYLPQEEVLASQETVFDEVAAFDSHDSIQKSHLVLDGLGFTPEMRHKRVSELSTGWKMRCALAKLLLTDADIYLFDEPTNHLDIVTQQWFITFLMNFRKGFLIISHDRAYLEKSCNQIMEIERGRVTQYSGNLDSYCEYKAIQQDNARTQRDRQEREIARIQANVDRMRASAVTARQAQSMLKQIDRIELIDIEPPLPTVSVRFPQPARSGTVVLTVLKITFGFDKPLFSDISFTLERGQRVALIAANGVGKTTLINSITGKYTPQSGSVAFGHAVRWTLFEQDQARVLDPQKTIFEEVRAGCPEPTDLDIRTILGAFLFSGDDIDKKICVLSGGEKNRIAMVKVLLQRANLLILDEPTNHMDLYTKDILRQALEQYEGTIFFVSHDLDFVNRLATHVIELTPTTAYRYTGNYDAYCAHKKAISALAEQKPLKSAPKITHSHSGSGELSQNRCADLEKIIEHLEHDLRRCGELLGEYEYGSSDYARAYMRYQDIEKKLADAFKDWENAVRATTLQ